MSKCEVCNTECNGKTCGGSCRAKLSRRTRTVDKAHAHGKAHAQPEQPKINHDEVSVSPALYDLLTASNAPRTNPDRLNYGAHLNSDQLHTAGKAANRVPIPGDSDYEGACVKVDGKWTTRRAMA